MAPSSFRLVATPPFDRSLKRITKKNAAIIPIVEGMLAVLQVDPQNATRRHSIKKLTNVEVGDGQWRIRSGMYRLRYDVFARDVVLYAINHAKMLTDRTSETSVI